MLAQQCCDFTRMFQAGKDLNAAGGEKGTDSTI